VIIISDLLLPQMLRVTSEFIPDRIRTYTKVNQHQLERALDKAQIIQNEVTMKNIIS
jgi:hypothetical protein